jgi:DNA-binding transcriptional ArsR family regulator
MKHDETLEKVMGAIGTLSNPVRWKIMKFIEKEYKATFTELSILTKLSPTSMRFHLKALERNLVVIRTTPRGPYKLTRLGIEGIKAYHRFDRTLKEMGWGK